MKILFIFLICFSTRTAAAYHQNGRHSPIANAANERQPPLRPLTPITGLYNYGNTCFFNALMQSLFALRRFRRLICDVDLSKVDSDATAELRLLRRLKRLFVAMETGNSAEVDVLRLVKSVEDERGARIYVGQQEDAHVYLGHLISMLERAWTQLPNVDPNGLRDIFLGSVRQFSETAKGIKLSDTTSYNLSPVSIYVNQGSFGDALKAAFVTNVDNLREGDALVRGTIRRQISRSPHHLIVHLMRMSTKRDSNGRFRHQKLNNPLQFPRSFRLGDFVGGAGENDRYTLRAIVIHSGSLEVGHYTAAVRRGKEWFLHDDSRVKAIPESEVSWRAFGSEDRSENAYMLFYDRQ